MQCTQYTILGVLTSKVLCLTAEPLAVIKENPSFCPLDSHSKQTVLF